MTRLATAATRSGPGRVTNAAQHQENPMHQRRAQVRYSEAWRTDQTAGLNTSSSRFCMALNARSATVLLYICTPGLLASTSVNEW